MRLKKLQLILLSGITHFHCTGNPSQICLLQHACTNRHVPKSAAYLFIVPVSIRTGCMKKHVCLAWYSSLLQKMTSTLWCCLVCSAPSNHHALTDVSLKWEGFFCLCIWGSHTTPAGSGVWMEAFFPATQPAASLHRGWHGSLPAASPAPACTSPPADIVLLWEQILHERYCTKNKTSLAISLGLIKRDEIISLCLFPMKLSSPAWTQANRDFRKTLQQI